MPPRPSSQIELITLEAFQEAAQEPKVVFEMANDRLDIHTAARLLQFDDAIRQLDQLVDILPWFWPAHFASAQVYLSQRNFDRAISSFEEVIKLDAANEPSYLRLIELYRRQGREGEVELVCRGLVSVTSRRPWLDSTNWRYC